MDNGEFDHGGGGGGGGGPAAAAGSGDRGSGGQWLAAKVAGNESIHGHMMVCDDKSGR